MKQRELVVRPRRAITAPVDAVMAVNLTGLAVAHAIAVCAAVILIETPI
jgi:hypothetical protein